MTKVLNFETADDVARAAAQNAVATLNAAIKAHGSATWVLAGGSSPLLAYKVIADYHHEEVDWSKVTVVMGDERAVPLTDPLSNWGAVAPVLFRIPAMSQMAQHVPMFVLPVEKMAADYEAKVARLDKTPSGWPRFDLVWLGMGDDGHTLSLFPDHENFTQTDRLVVPVHNSPKPPSDRITLSLRSLGGAGNVTIFAVGATKRHAVEQVFSGASLPIAQVADYIESTGGAITWYMDQTVRSVG